MNIKTFIVDIENLRRSKDNSFVDLNDLFGDNKSKTIVANGKRTMMFTVDVEESVVKGMKIEELRDYLKMRVEVGYPFYDFHRDDYSIGDFDIVICPQL